MKSSRDKMTEFMRSIFHAKHDRNMNEIDKQVKSIKTDENIDEVLSEIDPETWQKIADVEKKRIYRSGRAKTWLVIAVILLFIYLVISLCAVLACNFYKEVCKECLFGVDTPTPTLTPTTMPTPIAMLPPEQPTAVPENTPTPVVFSPSLFFLRPEFYPTAPLNGDKVWMMDWSVANVEPSLDDKRTWAKKSSTDPNAGGRVFYETTVGHASFKWKMDVALEKGVYLLYISDTKDGSQGGPYNFDVFLDDKKAAPYYGTGQVIFNGKSGGQEVDEWLSIGAYQIQNNQTVTVQTTISQATENAPFDIDRLLIIKLPESQIPILEGLSQGRMLYSLMDNEQADYVILYDGKVSNSDPGDWNRIFDTQAWNGTYAMREKPSIKPVAVVWHAPGRIPAGRYEMVVHFPREGSVPADFSLWTGESEVQRASPASVNQSDHLGEWYTLGTWDLAAEAAVDVRMTVNEGFVGKIGADAVALLKVAME